ncbi:MAG: restriction endonuclease [Candidatus Aenigmatarchaeota archaeon]
MVTGADIVIGFIVIIIAIAWLIASPISFLIVFVLVVGLIFYIQMGGRKEENEKAEKKLQEIEDFVFKDVSLEKIEKSKIPHVKKFIEAVNIYNKGNNKEAIKLAEVAKKLKSIDIENKEQIKREMLERKERLKREMFVKQQLSKGLMEYNDKWVTKSQFKKLKEIEIGLDKNFYNMSPYEFEEFIGKLFKAMGYSTIVTKGSGDFGIDVIAKNGKDTIAIQVKRFNDRSLVTPSVVQRTIGAMGRFEANKCMVITNAQFTTAALEAAKHEPIELWDKDDLHKMVRKYFIDNITNSDK